MTMTITTLPMIFKIGIIIVYYIIFAGLVSQVLKRLLHLPFEWVRKIYHLAYTMSIFVYLNLFSTWQGAVSALFILMIVFYIALSILEQFSIFKVIFVERHDGDFKMQVIEAQLSLAILIFVFRGLLGADWTYVAIVGAMVWGFGDATAALAGKAFGRRKLKHQWIEGTKTLEGTLSMSIISSLVIFLTLMVYAGASWYQCLIVALCVAPVSAVVELFSRNGSDTLTVPLSSSALTLVLMFLFSL